MFKKILIPLDGSPLAEAVLPHVQKLVEGAPAEIVLLHVVMNPALDFAFVDSSVVAQDLETLQAEAATYMNEMQARLKAQGLNVTTQVVHGPTADTIVAIAQDVDADLIALSTHGRTGLARVLMGSVADEVVRLSKIPVLLIRPQI